jgi:LysM repeat protein
VNALRIALGVFLALLLSTAAPVVERAASTGRAAARNDEAPPLEGRNFVYYTVQPGDSLASVERRFRISSIEAILDLNPDLDSGRLQPGRRIRIPIH